ncbi:MAG TPA: hypothetical protein GX694_12420 [Actinomycetales bacterium]|nr:hypothetical protein [Actinomycetales bacterium]
MEPVEINAGPFYLRALRADDRVDDRPALRALGETADDAVARRDRGWTDGTPLTWAACVQTDVDMCAEIRCEVDGDSAVVSARPVPGADRADEAAAVGVETVTRFVEGALGLAVVPG